MMTFAFRHRRHAFSMAEVLVAAGILAACLLPVIAFQQRGLLESGATQEDILARQILMDLCERFKSSEPAELKAAQANPALIERDSMLIPLKAGNTNSGPIASGRAASGITFLRRIEFTENMDGQVGLHRIVFVVSWASRAGKSRQVQMSRLIHAH